MSDEFRSGPDLTDPKQVAATLKEAANGLRQQAIASDSRSSAMAGHPCPSFFFTQSAAAMDAAAEMLLKSLPPTPDTVPVEQTPAPAETTVKRGPGRPKKTETDSPEPAPVS